MPETTSERRRESAARRRILDTATSLFYAEGVHSVGIDRIIAEANVAKATFYHHFPAKDDLVRAYLQDVYRQQQEAVADVRAAAANPGDAIGRIFDYLGDVGSGKTFRGCAFINAAAEYPDADHPVRQMVADHRNWTRDVFRDLLTEAGHPDPEHTARILMMVRDGIVVGIDLDDKAKLRARVRDAMTRVVERNGK